MGIFLEAAYRVLSEYDRPLPVIELTDIAISRGYLVTQGKTPSQTMKAKLSTNILNKREESLFMRTAEGTFGLRKWKKVRYAEYVADRFVKGLLQEEVVVFRKSSLSRYISGPGLHVKTLENSEDLLQECFYMQRDIAEKDYSVIQLVSVFLVKHNNRYLTYKRTKRLPESRLHDYYSIAFGGHLNPADIYGDSASAPAILPLFNIFQPELGSALLQRELSEELRFAEGSFPQITYKGLLYDDSREVSTQHLGIVYDVFLNDDQYEIGERGFLMNAKFETLSEIETRMHDFENWSLMILEHERQNGGTVRSI